MAEWEATRSRPLYRRTGSVPEKEVEGGWVGGGGSGGGGGKEEEEGEKGR